MTTDERVSLLHTILTAKLAELEDIERRCPEGKVREHVRSALVALRAAIALLEVNAPAVNDGPLSALTGFAVGHVLASAHDDRGPTFH